MAIGRYSDELKYTTNGRPVLGASVLVKLTDGTAADLFTDEGGLTAAANPIAYVPAAAGQTGLDSRGNLTFYATSEAPGPYYDIVVTPPGGTAFDSLRVRVDGAGSGEGGGGSDLPLPTEAGQVLVSGAAGTWEGSLRTAATAWDETPMPDTPDGSEGFGNSYALGPHSHPESTLYDGFGLDSANVVTASGALVTIPAPTVAQLSAVTLTEDCDVLLPEPLVGARFRLVLAQDATGGWEPTFPSNVAWVDAAHPTWSTAAGHIDVVDFLCVDGTNWIGIAVALGVVRPASPLTIVQTINGEYNDGGLITFEADITAGNSIIGLVAPQSGSTPTAPVGGGCTDWTLIGSRVAPPDVTNLGVVGFDVWLGTSSAGGSGSGIVDVAASGRVHFFMELQGDVALDGAVVEGSGTVTTAGDTFTTPAITASGSGGMPFLLVVIAEPLMDDDGPWDMEPWTLAAFADVGVDPPTIPATFGAFAPPAVLAYQQGTTPGGMYDGTFTMLFNATHDWASLSFILTAV